VRTAPSCRIALSLTGDMVAMPVEGVAFYFADYKDGKIRMDFPCRLFTTGDFCVVILCTWRYCQATYNPYKL
jgi:hypothetical protein